MRQTAWLAMLAAAGLAVVAGGTTTLRAALQDNLVVHLALDGNTNDSSPRNNDAVAGPGGAFYLPGPNADEVTRDPYIGSGSLDLTYGTSNEYVSLVNTLSDISFGTSTDFSVTLWAQRINDDVRPEIDDPSFISNKNWAGGGNPGWLIFADNDGWNWNWATEVAGSRRNFTGGALPAGEWHHIAVTHDRDGLATFYNDGIQVGSVSLSAGNVDTTALGFNTNIGQDGTGAYGPTLSHNLDDIGIWRRVLTPAEVFTILKEGRGGLDISEITTTLVPGDVNVDNVTNAADYALWNANVGFSTGTGAGTPASFAKGDADYNGIIDLADFKLIADNATPGLGVPEPGSLALAACGLGAFALLRRRGARR
ncbi:MAG: LamG-like jellyroll fold domain-containing protein [Planctomycetia bacterium]|nr:LamG-like jellyroll fold domain-containing protein [Planctomycetia bacterium]